jgi:glycerol transport system permease protein
MCAAQGGPSLAKARLSGNTMPMLRSSSTARAYLYLAPALAVMTLCGVVPLLFIFTYSLHDTFAGNDFVWVGGQWYLQLLTSATFWAAVGRSAGFSALVLAVEIPLGIYIALCMPPKGWLASLLIVVAAIPLLAPFIVVGYVWKSLILPKAGLIYETMNLIGIQMNMDNPLVAWFVLLAMDVWHWTSLVVLLCYAGLRTIPDDYYRAARIDGASPWAVFLHVQLPRLRHVLLIAVLLRLIDSFIIYTEAYVLTRGTRDLATTFLSQELVQTALVQFDLGEGSAMAIIYFLIVLVASWAFYTRIMPRDVNHA